MIQYIINRYNKKIAYEYYTIDGSKGTFIIAHGSCSNHQRSFIQYIKDILLAHKYNVIAYSATNSKRSFDPILSDGECKDVTATSYKDDLEDVYKHFINAIDTIKPLYIMGMSLGGFALLELLKSSVYDTQASPKAYLLAPVCNSTLWLESMKTHRSDMLDTFERTNSYYDRFAWQPFKEDIMQYNESADTLPASVGLEIMVGNDDINCPIDMQNEYFKDAKTHYKRITIVDNYPHTPDTDAQYEALKQWLESTLSS